MRLGLTCMTDEHLMQLWSMHVASFPGSPIPEHEHCSCAGRESLGLVPYPGECTTGPLCQ